MFGPKARMRKLRMEPYWQTITLFGLQKKIGFTLELSDGAKIEGTVDNLTDGRAMVRVNTPIPGF